MDYQSVASCMNKTYFLSSFIQTKHQIIYSDTAVKQPNLVNPYYRLISLYLDVCMQAYVHQ